MKSIFLKSVLAVVVTATGLQQVACAGVFGRRQSEKQANPTWHGGYYEAGWGMPLALVVPPKAEMQSHYGWGVGSTRVTPIQHQYEPGYPMPGQYQRGWFQPAPHWPTSTDQLGVYYIRGPW